MYTLNKSESVLEHVRSQAFTLGVCKDHEYFLIYSTNCKILEVVYKCKCKNCVCFSGNRQCLHLWYYMSGKDSGTLNVYQKYSNGAHSLLLSQSGEQGKLWRFAQAPLPNTGPEYRVSPLITLAAGH